VSDLEYWKSLSWGDRILCILAPFIGAFAARILYGGLFEWLDKVQTK
jgi:hypothetical protein